MGLFAILGKWVFHPFMGYCHLILHSFTFPNWKFLILIHHRGIVIRFFVHMPLFVISYLRSVLCPHGCLNCYMLLSIQTAAFTDLIFHNLQAVHTHNPAAPTAIFTGLSFRNTQCLSNCKFLITIRSLNSFRFLPALPYLYICNFPANAFPSLLLLLS